MRRILWRHRCAELYRAFINDPANSGPIEEQSHHLRHERLEERIVLSAPTIDQVENIDQAELGDVIVVDLSGITDGDAGAEGIKNVSAAVISPMDGVVQSVSVSYDLVTDPETGSLAITLNSTFRGTDTIRVTVTDESDDTTFMDFTITVPLAIDDLDTTTEDSTTSGNLLTNDNALLGETLSLTSITVGAETTPVDQLGADTEIEIEGTGLLTVNMDGSYTFDPQDDFQSLNSGSIPISFDYGVVATDALAMTTVTETGTLTITITGENDPPTIDLDADDSSGAVGNDYQATYTAGDPAIAAVDSDLVITDVDDTDLQSATVTLTNPQDGASESLGISVPEPGDLPPGVTVDATDPHLITITGPVSITDLQTWLSTLTYQNLAATPTGGVRTITVAVSDGTNTSTATSSITVALPVDLSIAISESEDPVEAGDSLVYTVTVQNLAGFADATGVVIQLNAPPEVTSASAFSPSVGSVAFVSGTTWNWTIGNLANNTSATVTVTVDVPLDAQEADQLTLSASVLSVDQAEHNAPGEGPDSASETTDIDAVVDIQVVSVSGPTSAIAGEQNLMYVFEVTNLGGVDATGLVVRLNADPNNLIESGTLEGSSSPALGAGDITRNNGDRYIDFAIGDLAAGETITLTYQADVDDQAAENSSFTVTASVETLTQTDKDSTNESPSIMTTITRNVDIDIVTTAMTGPSSANAGQEATYMITVTNNGPSQATNVAIDVPTPTGTSVVLASTDGSYSAADQSFILPTLESGVPVELMYVIKLDSNLALLGTTDFTVNATVDQTEVNESDTNSANDMTSVTTNVTALADLSISIDDNPDPVEAGNSTTYTITIANLDGFSDATGVVIQLDLPPEVPTDSVFSPSVGSVVYDSGTIWLWTLNSTLVSGGTAATLDITVDVPLSGSDSDQLTLTASVLSLDQEENTAPGEGPDTATETTDIDAVVDIEIVLVTGTDSVAAGGRVTYTFKVTNLGGLDATGLEVEINASPDSAIATNTITGSASETINSISVNNGDRRIDFDIGDLAAGDSIELTYQANTNGKAIVGSMFDVTASLEALDQTDKISGNNSDSTTTTIGLREVDLALLSTAPTTVVAGQDIVYTLTVDNLGPSDATGVVVRFFPPVYDPAFVTFDELSLSPTVGIITPVDTDLDLMTDYYLWTIGPLDSDSDPNNDPDLVLPELEFTFTTLTSILNSDNVVVSLSAEIFSGEEGTVETGNNFVNISTTVQNDPPIANDGSGEGDEDDVSGTVEVDLLTLASDDQTSADPAIAGAVLNFQILSQGTAILTDANGPHNAAGYLQGTASVVGSDLVYAYSGNIDGLRDGDVLTQVITYRATDSAGQIADGTVTIQITGQNDAPIIETLISPDANEANAITVTGTFDDLDRALGAGEVIHVLSVTPPTGYPFEVVPGSTMITFNAVTGKYDFSVDVIFNDDDPTGDPSNLVTLEFEIDDQIVTATGELPITVRNLLPSIVNYETDVQLSTLGELVIPITLSDPSVLDKLTVSVNRVAENDDVFETAVTNSNDPGDPVVWNPSAIDPRKGELIVRYNANDFDGLSFTLRIVATDDDTGVSSIVRVNATVPAGLGFLPVTPEPEETTVPAPLPFSLPPIPESTNTTSLPDNVQRALAPPAKGETVALELRIVWNYGEPDEWQEKIRELIAKDRKELQEKLQELSELLQGLPDNQYRAFLVRGDGTENQLMEVRIREGKIVDLKQLEAPSFTPGSSDVSSEPTAPEPMPGEPMSRLEGAFPSRNSEEPHELENTAADPFARFGRASHIEAWQSVYRTRAASVIDN